MQAAYGCTYPVHQLPCVPNAARHQHLQQPNEQWDEAMLQQLLAQFC
jgi:hypothetical protein